LFSLFQALHGAAGSVEIAKGSGREIVLETHIGVVQS